MYGEMDIMSAATQHPAVVGDSVPEAQHVLSKDDFLKLMLPDSPLVEEGRRKVSDCEGLGVTRSTYSQSEATVGCFLWSHQQSKTEWPLPLPQFGPFFPPKTVFFCVALAVLELAL